MSLAEAVMAVVDDLIAADGGRVEVVGAADGVVTLRLVLDGAACRECVMPRAFLETVAFDAACRIEPGLAGLVLVDPREP